MQVLAALWRKPTPEKRIPKKVFSIPEQGTEDAVFKLKYDSVQRQLQSIAGLDDLVSGLLFINIVIMRYCNLIGMLKLFIYYSF